MARSPITDVVKAFNALTMDEQRIFLDLVDPQPDEEEEEVQVKKKRRKSSSKSVGKSSHASSIAEKIQGTASGSNPAALCTYEIDGKVCKGSAGDGIHDHAMGYSGYHEFQLLPPLAQEAGAGG